MVQIRVVEYAPGHQAAPSVVKVWRYKMDSAIARLEIFSSYPKNSAGLAFKIVNFVMTKHIVKDV